MLLKSLLLLMYTFAITRDQSLRLKGNNFTWIQLFLRSACSAEEFVAYRTTIVNLGNGSEGCRKMARKLGRGSCCWARVPPPLSAFEIRSHVQNSSFQVLL